jgi:hypothetical protein
MAYRTGNYSVFYVDTPFNQNNLEASSTCDFVYYNLLKAWKANDSFFPFNDSRDKNYNDRDGSDWETTLRPRLRERLRNSKNTILFLSSITKNSMALREEIEYVVKYRGTSYCNVLLLKWKLLLGLSSRKNRIRTIIAYTK